MESGQHSRWLICMASVVFDIDIGQKVLNFIFYFLLFYQFFKIEHLVPEGSLSFNEQSDVAFHAFPDSMSQEIRSCSSVRDSIFFFRIRRKRALYGFVFCRQRQDERLTRGGDQRAVIVISEYPFSSVLMPLSQYLGTLYFSEGVDAIDRFLSPTLSKN